MDMDAMLDGIIRKARETNNIVEGDYLGGDNLYYCGKCNTPKQCVVDFLGDTRIVPCSCKCMVEQQKAEEEERKKRDLALRVQKYRSMGFPESDMKNWTFANDDMSNPKITKAMQNYVENFDKYKRDGKGLLLYGNVGSGKTYAACEVANALIDKGIPCLVTNFARIANTVNGMYEGKQEYYDSLNRFPLLVIDDLAAERKTEYMGEIVYNVIDSRERANLPIIITTNLTNEELKNPADMTYKRIFSRLLGRCFPLEVVGKDRRLQRLKNEFADMAKELGV